MKLTQRTIFQCFDKPTKPSTVILDDTDEEILECEVPLQPSISTNQLHQPDFLLPIHVRQENPSSATDTLPRLNQWKLLDVNDEIPANSLSTFTRLYPINPNEQTSSPHPCKSAIVQFIPIKSSDHQMELFQKYTTDELSTYAQSIIDWKSMFEYFQDYRKKALEQNQYEQLPWTEIYRPRHSAAYLGSHTKSIRRLNEWFTYWTKKLTNEQATKSTRKRRKNDDNSDEDFIDDSNLFYYNRRQTQTEHPQMIYIHGLGTTSLVHALAEEHHFKITEINGSQCRARPSLIKQLEQVTSHHYLSLKRHASDTISESPSNIPVRKKAKNERGTIISFFNNNNNTKKSDSTKETRRRPKRAKTKENESVASDQQLLGSSSVQVEKTSLILFDEIDTLTTDDNFWSCLKKLLETAKKPIILTSNSRSNPDDAISHLSKIGDYQMIDLELNDPEMIYCFLRLILLVEMLEMPSLDELIDLHQSCACDLRRSLLTLQFLAQSSSETVSEKEKPHRTKTFPSSKVFETMFYSYLHEQWEESILKPLFDDLTRKYTSDYEQATGKTKRIESQETLKRFLQEQDIDTMTNHSSINLDYRPYIRQICETEQARASESHSTRRLRHGLGFRGCSLQWSDFSLLSHGLD